MLLLIVGSTLVLILYGCYCSYFLERNFFGQEVSVPTNPIFVIAIPIVLSVLLLAFFYLFNQLYYFFILLYMSLCFFAVSFAVSPPIFLAVKEKKWRLSMAAALGLLIVILWFIQPESIFISNFIAASLCITAVAMIRIPSLRIASLLFFGLFVYDVFWVFFSKPGFGENVMTSVATRVNLPLLLMFPIDEFDFAILGLGDVALPGVLIKYALRHGYTYLIVSCFAYALGITMAFEISSIFEAAQPALLYLVPSLLASVMGLGWYRGELKELWTGPPQNTVVSVADDSPA
eukprot:TRINITY_DN5465_c0_g1_i1.p1 TRINITY_DN5465_c0_g1~~TRINITY_DN5465_c0_g1_i1.p1  ORF type:complete len:290 (+),score=43.17 TRINITY_DN5465_c0_g1_i1:179-1048(+)